MINLQSIKSNTTKMQRIHCRCLFHIRGLSKGIRCINIEETKQKYNYSRNIEFLLLLQRQGTGRKTFYRKEVVAHLSEKMQSMKFHGGSETTLNYALTMSTSIVFKMFFI